ncbi:PREDICTED: peroxidasin-like protein [Branchiostoma belcheri]|uniref:Peroxidasin-like protein n=1 Tax=Branchiostoma belcheri TaxID=7741 RepID=A0A6P4Z1U7_BRABE|nr:PREDICTED: peroxidasin-like protein [Branchiostoma belcheri]
MPKLFLLDLSFNRLRRFPWSSLKSASNILHLKLNNNEISKVDAYIDFPQSLTYLHLQFNSITTIAETFLHGFKSPKQTLYLRIWQNPLLCDCKIQWIVRLRRCVWEHRDEGCVNASPVRVMRCILAKCNFHPNGVAVILDWLQLDDQAIVKQKSSEDFLRCDSPQELKGNLLRDVSLKACASPNSSGSPQQTSSPDNAGIHESEKSPTETEPPTLVIYSWERTTVKTSEFSLFWKGLTAGILGGALALLVVAFIIRWKKVLYRRT